MPRGKSPPNKLPQPVRDRIVDLYKQGLSSRKVAAIVDCSKCTVLQIIHEVGETTRSIGHPRQAPVHEDFFDSIDTEEKAYWLGFLVADGAVVGDYVKLRLSSKDLDHLQRFRDALAPGRTIYTVKVSSSRPHAQSEVCLFSPHMVAALVKHNVVQNKTWTVRVSSRVPPDLMRHYWRGHFDGDGCVCYSPFRGNPNWMVEVVGNQGLMNDLHSWLSAYVPELSKPVNTRGDLYRVAAGGTGKPRLFAKALYEDATIFLPRKMEEAQRLIAYQPMRKTEAFRQAS